MWYPGFQNVTDGLEVAHPENNHQRSIRPFFFDLLGWKHLAAFEIMGNLIIDQDRDGHACLFRKPDIGAALQNVIQFFRNGFESGL